MIFEVNYPELWLRCSLAVNSSDCCWPFVPCSHRTCRGAAQRFKRSYFEEKYRAGITTKDTFGYIYTSGTTGLPACIMTYEKFMIKGVFMPVYIGINENDILYTALPLYHSAGGMLGVGVFMLGATAVISRKFSATNFFRHCTKYNATCVQYIGELARYLMNAKPSEWDTKHKVRVAFGNGMRGEVWVPFQKRFRIPEIGEFYGATEGNQSFVNHVVTTDFVNFPGAGACGKIVLFKMLRGEPLIIKHDPVTEMPVRDPRPDFAYRALVASLVN